MTTRRLTVRALVVNADGKILVLRRSPDDVDVPGRVDFPGGGVEPRETCEVAMVRELEEETSLHVTETDLRLVYAFTAYEHATGTAVIRQLYVVHNEEQEVRLSQEHDAYLWQAPEEVKRLFTGISWQEAIDFVLEHDLLRI